MKANLTIFNLFQFCLGNSFEIGFQAPANGLADQADSAVDEVPHAARGNPQILAAGRTGGRGGGAQLRLPRYDGRAEPGQRDDGHRSASRFRGKHKKVNMKRLIASFNFGSSA